jgi:protein-disulfide isomerase
MQWHRHILGLLACLLLYGAAPAEDLPLVNRDGVKLMLANPGTVPVGAPHPDVVIVEYFDYNCPYCKKLVPVLQALLAQDHKAAVLYKDWPILSAVSGYAAASALAAGWQGKYLAAHDEQVDAVLQGAGVNIDVLKKDRVGHAREIAALLERNDEEAHSLNLDGTPALVVGRQLVPGILDLGTLQRLVANSRRDVTTH